MTPEEHYTFRPSMFFEDRYQITDAKGTPIGVGRDLSDAAMLTRHLNEARTSGTREQVEPLEALTTAQAGIISQSGEENARLRALVQRFVNHNAKWVGKGCLEADIEWDGIIGDCKEHGFVPTNTEDNG